ncbi:hypothetical protein GCM10027446_14530 [Angustibacter peucedani]
MDEPPPPTVPATGRWPQEGLRVGDLLVRVWRPDDVPQLVALLSDEQMRRWSPTVTLPDEQNCAERVRAAMEGERQGRPTSFAVVEADHPEQVLGSFDWRDVHPPGFSVLDVGYGVAAAARGRGVAGSVLRAVTDWLLDPDSGDVERVQLDHSVENAPSCRTALRAGFPVEGRRDRYLPLREHADAPVVRHDVCLHGRVREDSPGS